jgi:hypothetical protein
LAKPKGGLERVCPRDIRLHGAKKFGDALECQDGRSEGFIRFPPRAHGRDGGSADIAQWGFDDHLLIEVFGEQDDVSRHEALNDLRTDRE